MAQPTDPLASGGSTVEGKLSIGTAVAGVVIALIGATQPFFQQAADANPNNFWLRIVAVVAGGAMASAASYQLTKSRTLVKNGILDVFTQGAAAVAPLIAGAVLKKYLVSGTTQAAAVSVASDGTVALKPVTDPKASLITAPVAPGQAPRP